MRVKGDYTFTSESVGEGHPDKLCDQVADVVLDDAIRQDADSKVACECLVTTGLVLVAGELTTSGYIDIQYLVRDLLERIGYDSPDCGMDYHSCSVLSSLHDQSPDIARGLAGSGRGHGAGDQGMMFGYACRDTPELMPAPIHYAHAIIKRAAMVRRDGTLPYLLPDGKCQVTVRYEDGKPSAVETVVLSLHHRDDPPGLSLSTGSEREAIIEEIIKPAITGDLLSSNPSYLINPAGQFVVGGPAADTGVTGRKSMVDSYGAMARHGGGAFSGKDPSKVDRSAAYVARYIAKNLVASGACDECEVELSYAIGVAEPVSVFVSTFDTATCEEERIAAVVRKHFPLTPDEIIERFDLLRPIYSQTACYGHFGRGDFAWEAVDLANVLADELEVVKEGA